MTNTDHKAAAKRILATLHYDEAVTFLRAAEAKRARRFVKALSDAAATVDGQRGARVWLKDDTAFEQMGAWGEVWSLRGCYATGHHVPSRRTALERAHRAREERRAWRIIARNMW